MKNVRIVYTPARGTADPLAAMPVVAVRAKIGGEDYGVYEELEKEDAISACRTIEKLLGVLVEMLDGVLTAEEGADDEENDI